MGSRVLPRRCVSPSIAARNAIRCAVLRAEAYSTKLLYARVGGTTRLTQMKSSQGARRVGKGIADLLLLQSTSNTSRAPRVRDVILAALHETRSQIEAAVQREFGDWRAVRSPSLLTAHKIYNCDVQNPQRVAPAGMLFWQ